VNVLPAKRLVFPNVKQAIHSRSEDNSSIPLPLSSHGVTLQRSETLYPWSGADLFSFSLFFFLPYIKETPCQYGRGFVFLFGLIQGIYY
jgi:hypothetical protein